MSLTHDFEFTDYKSSESVFVLGLFVEKEQVTLQEYAMYGGCAA